jgi:hypothetical protein
LFAHQLFFAVAVRVISRFHRPLGAEPCILAADEVEYLIRGGESSVVDFKEVCSRGEKDVHSLYKHWALYVCTCTQPPSGSRDGEHMYSALLALGVHVEVVYSTFEVPTASSM